MSDKHRWERMISLMDQQRELLDDFAAASDELRRGLHGRDWPGLEVGLKKLDGMSHRLENVEYRRRSLMEKLCCDSSPEKCIAALPNELRGRVLTSRSELKARVVTVRSKMRGLAGYANSRSRLGREIMEELVPSTRGRMYDKRGRSAAAGREPLVVSRHL